MRVFADHQRGERAEQALQLAVKALLADQADDGRWEKVLDNKISVDAHHLLLHTFLGLPEPCGAAEIRAWIRCRQTDEGGWPNFDGGPDEVSVTLMAYLALRAGGDAPGASHMSVAAGRIRQLGGLRACRASTRLWLALFGFWPWRDVAMLPAELVLLPSRSPISLEDFADWARYLVVPLGVVAALRPVRRPAFDLDELMQEPQRSRIPRGPGLMGAYRMLMPSRLRARALARAREWLLDRQQADGCWNGTHSATVYAAIALHLLDGDRDAAAVERAVGGLSAFVSSRDDGLSRVQFSHGPVWDTANTLLALDAAGVSGRHPAMSSARAWLLDLQTSELGDWAARRPGLEPGGWSFQKANRISPDTDDTALVLRALRTAPQPDDPRLQAAADRGHRWLEGMAWRDGGWAAFDTDARVRRVLRLPFHDARAVTDPPTVDVTAHVVECLAEAGERHEAAVRRGVRWLLEHQEPDGAWFGQWGCNYLYGTTAALCALAAAGTSREHHAVSKAIGWLYSRQNDDGGWGEDQRSYRYDPWRGRGRSTPSQTGWVLHALVASGELNPRVEAGVDWLLRFQEPSGLWSETAYTGTGFPWDAPIRYGSYPQVFPVLALAEYRRATERAESPRPGGGQGQNSSALGSAIVADDNA